MGDFLHELEEKTRLQAGAETLDAPTEKELVAAGLLPEPAVGHQREPAKAEFRGKISPLYLAALNKLLGSRVTGFSSAPKYFESAIIEKIQRDVARVASGNFTTEIRANMTMREELGSLQREQKNLQTIKTLRATVFKLLEQGRREDARERVLRISALLEPMSGDLWRVAVNVALGAPMQGANEGVWAEDESGAAYQTIEEMAMDDPVSELILQALHLETPNHWKDEIRAHMGLKPE